MPFSDEKDFETIRDRIISSDFEPLSNEVPEIWRRVVIKGKFDVVNSIVIPDI